MAGMMSLGMFLRVSGLAPDPFLAVFYSGLGAALLPDATLTQEDVAALEALLEKGGR